MSFNPYNNTESPGLSVIERKLHGIISEELSRFGILCRVFSRIKSKDSITEKTTRKGQGYYNQNKKMRDLFGVRVVAYFYEDLDFIEERLSRIFDEVERNVEKGGETEFKPLPRNIVFSLPPTEAETLREIQNSTREYLFVDYTFELQLRSVLSEGWHEVDHVLRYKCHEEWRDIQAYSRMLNGIYATLETSDRALKSLFDDVAYYHYKKNNITGMLRTKFRLDFIPSNLSENLSRILAGDKSLLKRIHKIDRREFLKSLADSKIYLPVTFDNIVFIINRMYLNNDEIQANEPLNVKLDLDTLRLT